ncbi:hypothetical protein JW977_00975 [Candidatus Falkowbacteria bacterium]|nr:hypothetical protein [Candidatus Falkowbacteria bacterium]
MNYLRIKSQLFICFNKLELKQLFESAKKAEIIIEMKKMGLSFNDLRNNKQKMIEISDALADKTVEHKNEHEIFAAAFCFLDFYKPNSQVGFELKNNFDISKDKITDLNDLKKAREENTLSDFIIVSDDGLRNFQLKRYRGELKTEYIFNFIKGKLSGYGNNLGFINLLIILQVPNSDVSVVDFEKLNKQISGLNLNFEGQILISYNENNKFDVINRVYPELGTSRIPITFYS